MPLSALDPFYLLLITTLVLLAWIGYLEWRLKRLLVGKSGASLEEAISSLGQDVDKTNQTNEAIQEHLLKMEERLRRSVQRVKTVRFNPFPDQGGNYSFALGLLDERGDGVVVSTLYSRDKTSVYAKPIKNYASEFELTTEEKQAVAK